MPSQVLETGGSAGKLQEVCSGCIYWGTSDDSKNIIIGALVTSVRCLQSVTVNRVLIFTTQVYTGLLLSFLLRFSFALLIITVMLGPR